jgi:uncharacterized lipoprotein YddW (UPF0748 family)
MVPFWRCSLVGTLTGILFTLPLSSIALAAAPAPQSAPAPSQAQASPTVAVVQSPENAPYWQAILDRLQQAGTPYEVIRWETVQRTVEPRQATVLFLPNVETISATQVLAIQDWLNRGGRIIVTGAIGRQSSPGVQQALRSLLGAYWEAALPDRSTLQPLVTATHRWLRSGATEQPIAGGSLISTSLISQPVATWNSSAGSSTRAGQTGSRTAIVATQQTTFLGWNWGNPDISSIDFDGSWIKAAVDRFQNLPPLLAASTPPRPIPSPSSPVARSPENPSSRYSPSPNSQPSPAIPRPSSIPESPTADPAEQVAPPGLPVEPNNQRITLMEATAMKQELTNLIGRFESALLAAESATSSTDLQVTTRRTTSTQESLTASVDRTLPLANPTSPSAAILQQARQGLTEFSARLQQQNYAGARQQWLETRQLLWQNFPTDRPFAQSEIRAMWMDRETIVRAGSRQGLARIFDQLKAAGINTVFFETVNAGYPIYPSRVAPEQNPLTRQWDPLAAAVDLAHERGMELHAWVWTFAAGNRPHNAILGLPSDYPGPIIAAHPDWANYDNRGNLIPIGQGKPFLDPANPAVRQYLLSLFEEIVTQYQVDGLQLDYIRYPFQDPGAGRTYGYGLAARQQFQNLTGVDPLTLSPQSPQWQQWTEFRANQVSSFVAEVSKLVHRRPNLILSTSVFALPEHERVQDIQQSWETWARNGHVDMIVLMSYALDTNRLEHLAMPWIDGEINLGSTLVLPGIRLLNLPTEMVLDQMQALRDASAGGYALFATDNLAAPLQTILNRTQGADRSPSSIPYRQPFTAAADRFTALRREWSYLLSQGQLWMREPELAVWRTQADAVTQALNQLAAHPDRQSLAQARTALQTFRSQFDDWMYLQALNQNYRVHTWENRLAVLEKLLDYGEQTVLLRQAARPE